jgi:hypothetical protein
MPTRYHMGDGFSPVQCWHCKLSNQENHCQQPNTKCKLTRICRGSRLLSGVLRHRRRQICA